MLWYIIDVADRLNVLALLRGSRQALERFQGLWPAPFLVMGGLIDHLTMIVEVIKERTDIVPINANLTTLPLLRGDVELQRVCQVQVKCPFTSTVNWESLSHFLGIFLSIMRALSAYSFLRQRPLRAVTPSNNR